MGSSYEKEAAVEWSGGRAGRQWDEIRLVVEGLQTGPGLSCI